MRSTQRGDRIMMSSGNTSGSFHDTPNLFFLSCLNPDRNQIRPILWQHGSRLIWGFKFSLALGFGGYCWLTSKCPSCPQSSLPSDTVLGAIIPVGLAFQNKGCMFSICSSKEGHIAAGPREHAEAGEPMSNLAASSPSCPGLSFFWNFWSDSDSGDDLRKHERSSTNFWISDVASEGGPKTVEEPQEGLMWLSPGEY